MKLSQDPRAKNVGLAYIADQTIYMLWKYLNSRRFIQKDALTFWDIKPEGHIDSAVSLFFIMLEILDIPLEGATFRKGDCLGDGEQLIPVISSDTLTGLRLKTEQVRSTDIETYEDFGIQQYQTKCLLYGSSSMLNFLEFNNKLTEKTSAKLSEFVNNYIDRFINDGLKIKNKNFYRFDKQKRVLVDFLHASEENYGNRFLIEASTHATVQGIYYQANEGVRTQEYIFAHTLIALEKLGYFVIEDIFVNNPSRAVNEQENDYYKVNITLSNKFYEEFIPRAKVAEETTFDEATSSLTFNGKNIEISKTKDSDPHYLLTILFRDKHKVWAYDEIREDVLFQARGKKYNPHKDWRKIYNAAYSVNNKVQKATQISDFLNATKTSVAIKRPYL